ncbi:DUF3105 domain-containing protein [Nocardioides albidus]|uniref:DUF3105 domain-containing protein n=1 Tax=Nocardioides albidus TaxID=1517589 RepID=UPI0013050DB8|nr:DUF3105 domain-containing protein [Nocardioides albidus]
MSEPPFPPPSSPPPPPPPPHYGPPPPLPPGIPTPPRRRSPLPIVLAVLAAALAVAIAVLVPVVLSKDDADPEPDEASDGPSSSEQVETDLGAVEEFPGLTRQHVAVGEEVDYPQSPPVGGDHAPYWLECGVYDEPVPEVSVVHDLEHGTVWLTYRPDDVDAAGVDQLAGQLPDNGILSPYDDQEAPVVITVWGRQLALTGPDDPRIALFVAEYGAGDTAPEPFASCHGGVDPSQLPPSGTTV